MITLPGSLKLPDGILAQHMAVLGKTRSGKSSVMRLFVEHLLTKKRRACVIDPKGDWWGLRSSADGRHAGHEVLIFGGARADLPLNEHAGKSVAELVATGNRPCVIDLGGWMVGERTRFYIDFASTLFRLVDDELHLVIDEVHNFAPQGKVLDPDAGKMLHWSNRLASEGAGKGLVILSASQRPQKVHKDFLTCAETLVAMRVIHALDRTAVKEWLDGAGDPAMAKEVLNTLASMERGEGWVWSPEAKFGPERIKFPMFATYDSFAAPSAGSSRKPLKGWAEVDLDKEKQKLEAIVEQEKANDPKALKLKVLQLERELAKVRTTESGSNKPAASGRAESLAMQAQFRSIDKRWRKVLAERDKIIGDLKQRLGRVGEMARVPEFAYLAEAPVYAENGAVHSPTGPDYPPNRPIHSPKARNNPPKAKPLPGVPGSPPLAAAGLGKCHRLILDTLAWFEAIGDADPGWERICALSGRHPNTKTMTNARGELRSQGLLDDCRLTDAGRALATVPDIDPTLDGLHGELRKKLRGHELAIFDLVVEAGGEIPQNEVTDRLGLHPNTKTYTNARGRLASTFGLIRYQGSGDDRLICGTSLMYPQRLR